MTKIPFPGYALVKVDENDERDDEFNGGPQMGELIAIESDEGDTSRSTKLLRTLVGKTVYWQQYAEANFTRTDKQTGDTIAFIALDKIVGYEE